MIFEPFFTTKRDKRHRGIGLAWVYGIVTNLRGGVAVSSQPGHGTSVRIYLPAEKKFLDERRQFSGEELRGTENVLFVDDDPLMLTMGRTILAEHGYKVEVAEGGKQALDLISKREIPFDVVLTDMVMPVMSGREVAEKLHQVAPATRIICMSGYPWPAPPVKNLTFLKKPFTAQELLSRIRSVLSES
jgi:CheY-like chemotaxis protein